MRTNPVADQQDVQLAQDILRGKDATPRDLLALAIRLAKVKRFTYARRLLAKARQHTGFSHLAESERIEIGQKHALFTYKDPDLPAKQRLDDALTILQEIDDLRLTTNPETLGLAGAIHKRKWELDTQKVHLERSLTYYLRGSQSGVASDYGYTAVNAAYVLDLLASLELADTPEAGLQEPPHSPRGAQAQRIREEIVQVLPPLLTQPAMQWLSTTWWFLVTVAEAHFGLGHYDEAREWLGRAKALPDIPSWELESTARQLATLARIQDKEAKGWETVVSSPAWEVLREFLGNRANGLPGLFLGKVGLALSGGGFRASLFHLGVLAKLAELDLLRHVEVLSCVSGGSIVGAHYYLELRRLLQAKVDGGLTRQDYVDLVKQLERDFLSGVQRNLRTRVGSNVICNLKMILPSYSRTHRLGELYEQELYAKVQDGHEGNARWLNNLFIHPMGPDGNPVSDFTPKYENWGRSAKVPMLILNATTLNTGHNWQFTASFMGEPPGATNPDIDSNERLRRMYYWEAPPAFRQYRLGYAVAASSCVPGLFEPITLSGLYPGRTVSLVDGGVHDNQGVAGLLEQDCQVLLVSDASGQMETEPHPSKSPLPVTLRSNSVLQARVRDIQYRVLEARRESGILRRMMFIHLKKDLDSVSQDWQACQDPKEASDEAMPSARRGVLTGYGLRKDLQKLLSGIRTDLDSFSDAEAFALMTSGYRMAQQECAQRFSDFLSSSPPSPVDWRFLQIQPVFNNEFGRDESHARLKRLLEVGGGLGFKVWKLSSSLQLAFVAFALVCIWWLWNTYPLWADYTPVTLGSLALASGCFILGKIVGETLLKVINFRDTVWKIGMAVALAGIASWAAWIHLGIFDRWFLRLGRLASLLVADQKGSKPTAK